jgi:ribosomal protein S18 acetylase RimI-like enzyme
MITSIDALPVEVLMPDRRRDRRRFVALEREVMRGEPLHVPELRSSVSGYLRGRSPFYEEIEHALFIASNGRARSAAMINRRWQRDKGEDAGFVGYFAAAPDAGPAAVEMLHTAERWLADRGARTALGPFNGAAMHGLGTLTDAFDEEPIFPCPWQPPYYPELFAAAGYRPAYPFWAYDIDFASERYRAVSRRALADARCAVRSLDKKRWAAEIETTRALFNETFRSEWEFHRMTSAEFHEPFDQFKAILDPRQHLIAEVNGEPAGFCIGIPGWTKLFRSLNGKLGPLQIARLFRGANRYDRAGLLFIGVREQYRSRHIGQTLAATLYRRYEELGLRGASYFLVNDSNLASRRLAESFGARGRVLYTVYDKPLPKR